MSVRLIAVPRAPVIAHVKALAVMPASCRPASPDLPSPAVYTL